MRWGDKGMSSLGDGQWDGEEEKRNKGRGGEGKKGGGRKEGGMQGGWKGRG